MNTHKAAALALCALLTSCAAPPSAADNAPQQAAPDRAIVSNASARSLDYNPPPQATPPVSRRAPAPDPTFNKVAFDLGGSGPGIRAQYEAAATAYRQAAAQAGSPEREQYLQAAAQMDKLAADLGTR